MMELNKCEIKGFIDSISYLPQLGFTSNLGTPSKFYQMMISLNWCVLPQERLFLMFVGFLSCLYFFVQVKPSQDSPFSFRIRIGVVIVLILFKLPGKYFVGVTTLTFLRDTISLESSCSSDFYKLSAPFCCNSWALSSVLQYRCTR